MLSRVARTIDEHGLFGSVGRAPSGPSGRGRGNASPTEEGASSEPSRRRILVAVSGGPDSMALLACLWELAPRLALTLEVAVVDHGLRPEAAHEGDLVEERARVLGLTCHRLSVDVRATRAAGGRGGVQDTARALRLEALERCARARSLGAVALGHNADDQSETVLFRILRGTGVEGLSGIPVWRAPFARPLLEVTRREILTYLRRRSLPFVEDSSNLDLRYARARLRHRILPLLREENPRVDEALRRLAAGAAAVSAAATRAAGAQEPRGSGGHIPSSIARQVAAAARAGNGTKGFDLPGSRRIVVTYGRVSILSPGAAVRDGRSEAEANEDDATPVQIDGDGSFPVGQGAQICVQEHRSAEEPPQGEWAWFDGDKLVWPLILRRRRPGDRMRPRRGTGTRKVADLMIDAKIPVMQRGLMPVVAAADGNLLFVAGLRPSAVGEPGPETRRWVGMALRPAPEEVN